MKFYTEEEKKNLYDLQQEYSDQIHKEVALTE